MDLHTQFIIFMLSLTGFLTIIAFINNYIKKRKNTKS